MEQREIYTYLRRYFQLTGCEILEDDGEHRLAVRLTPELDKKLMNRHFYWQYVEMTGQEGKPTTLYLTTKAERCEKPKQKEELIHFGSPRLQQIFQSTKALGGFVRLYENTGSPAFASIPLEPWLGVNYVVSYQCDRKKDLLVSIGLHLISGTVVNHFDDALERLELTGKIPDYCFTISPLIRPQSGLRRIEKMISDAIEKDDHSWAEKAKERWMEELDLLEHFYARSEEKPESYYIEKEALKNRYEPVVRVEVINGGIFYLSKEAQKLLSA